MPQYGFLDTALNDYINAINGVWAANFQTTGVNILLSLGAFSFAIYMLYLLVGGGDFWSLIMGFGMTCLSLGALYCVFLFAETFASEIYTGFQHWAQQVTGESPATLTPSGLMEQGLQLARIFWAASGLASWFRAPTSALATVICSIVVVVAFGFASIILLLAQIEIWSLIVGGFILLAFASLPWTWGMFPGWGMSILSLCIKIFFIFAIVAVGLTEARAWTVAMAGASTTIVEDASIAWEAALESILFLGLIYYVPNFMAAKVLGSGGPVMGAGEAFLGGLMATGAWTGASAAGSALTSGAVGKAAIGVVSSARQVINSMLLG
jgi:P-type conjugative transfer protein TrbL